MQIAGVTFTQAASVTPNPVTGATATVSALASYGLGVESGITYTWSLVNGPAPVSFAASGTNAAKNTTASFTQAGSYKLRCMASYQTVSATSDVYLTNVTITFTQPATVAPSPVITRTATVQALAASTLGSESGVTYTWSLVHGPDSVVFAPNGTNAAKSAQVTFFLTGEYVLRCTAALLGVTATSDVLVSNVATDLDQYLNVSPLSRAFFNPASVSDPAPPPPLAALSPRLVRGKGNITFSVKAPANAVVTFIAMGGTDHNAATIKQINADSVGNAIATFMIMSGGGEIMVYSTACAGTVRFIVLDD